MRRITVVIAAATVTMTVNQAHAQMTSAQRAELVLRLIPATARPHATIVLRDGESEETSRAGNGHFICVSDTASSTRLSMVCHHDVLDERLRFERALGRETGLKGGAFRERLCAEVKSREMTVPNGAMEITASLAIEPDGAHAGEMTVYHLLWVPFATESSIGVMDEDPGDGRPWLHHAGSCGAHVMWSEVVSVSGGV